MNATQNLEAKGYDFDEINDILYFKTKFSEEGLDLKVRKEFELNEVPIHLWEAYYVGDAKEEILEEKVKKFGFEDVKHLLAAMTTRLNGLVADIPEKKD